MGQAGLNQHSSISVRLRWLDLFATVGGPVHPLLLAWLLAEVLSLEVPAPAEGARRPPELAPEVSGRAGDIVNNMLFSTSSCSAMYSYVRCRISPQLSYFSGWTHSATAPHSLATTAASARGRFAGTYDCTVCGATGVTTGRTEAHA